MKSFPILLSIVLLFFSCTKEYEETYVSFDGYQLEDGFELKAVVAEPLVEAPVNISFDDQGRLWAIEMAGYMQSIEGKDPKMPVGRILVFEDKDNDGQMDHTTIFLDQLKLVRAIAHVYGGLLYAEPPNLYFTEINDDLTPGKRTLIDANYAVGGNVEHQPNGLVMNIDNWIYNAKSTKRYRKQNGQWKIENTSFRGQWGITHDAIGRLLYNDNSNQVRGDWALPNVLNQHANFKPKLGVDITIVNDQRVYPIQATAVNRGYIKGNLDEEGKLINFTSACAPLYFQGTSFPQDYQDNVFVCGPEVNLIKRNVVDPFALRRTGKQVWQNKEFLVSKDEAFRPVNLQNGPDGALYIVDMHRGIIQHKTYMTSYLRDLYIKKGLDSIVGMGRILKVVKQGHKTIREIDLTKLSTSNLLDSLSSENTWIRNKSQQLLVNTQDMELTEPLKEIVNTNKNEVTRIHALYTLEGLGVLNDVDLMNTDIMSNPALCAHSLKLLSQQDKIVDPSVIAKLVAIENEMIDYHLGFYLAKHLTEENGKYLIQLIQRYNAEEWFLEPVYSGVSGNEELLLNLTDDYDGIKTKLHSLKVPKREVTTSTISKDGLTRGLPLYRNQCASCHGIDGEGLKGLAPPLLNSEYVSESPEQLVAIMLYGLTGPISVNGIEYTFNVAMPGIGNQESISDQDIVDIGNYIRNAFTTSPQNLTLKKVDSLRNLKRPKDQVYTVKELNESY